MYSQKWLNSGKQGFRCVNWSSNYNCIWHNRIYWTGQFIIISNANSSWISLSNIYNHAKYSFISRFLLEPQAIGWWTKVRRGQGKSSVGASFWEMWSRGVKTVHEQLSVYVHCGSVHSFYPLLRYFYMVKCMVQANNDNQYILEMVPYFLYWLLSIPMICCLIVQIDILIHLKHLILHRIVYHFHNDLFYYLQSSTINYFTVKRFSNRPFQDSQPLFLTVCSL